MGFYAYVSHTSTREMKMARLSALRQATSSFVLLKAQGRKITGCFTGHALSILPKRYRVNDEKTTLFWRLWLAQIDAQASICVGRFFYRCQKGPMKMALLFSNTFLHAWLGIRATTMQSEGYQRHMSEKLSYKDCAVESHGNSMRPANWGAPFRS